MSKTIETALHHRSSATSHRTLRTTLRTLAAFALVLIAGPAMAAITVDSTAWGDDGDGATCTLWEAVQTATAMTPTGGCTGSGTIELQEAALYETQGQLPKITGSVTLEGNGATLEAAAGSPDHRFFNIGNQATLSVYRLTLTGGKAARGGAIWISTDGILEGTHLELSGNEASISGGAIYSRGAVDLDFATLGHNTAPIGGAITAEEGWMDVINSTFYLNTASNRGGAVTAWGNAEPLIFNNCTFSENTAYEGGALFRAGSPNSAPDTVVQVTFKGNEVLPLGSGNTIYLEGGRAFAMEKTALHSDDPASALCAGDLTNLVSGGHNAATDASCALTHAEDHPSVHFTLTELIDHGAFTKVHVPRCDAAPGAGYDCSILFDQYPCGSVQDGPDQRGVNRFHFGDEPNHPAPRCDIGAYESICHTSFQDPTMVTTLLYTDEYKSDGQVLNNGACAGLGETAYFETVPAGGCHVAWQVYGLGLGIRKVWFIEDEATCPVDCFLDPEGCKEQCTSDPTDWVASLPPGLQPSPWETTPDDDYFIVDAPNCDVPPSRYVMEFLGGRVDFWDPETAIESGGGS